VKFIPLALEDTYLIQWEPIVDERGFFARVWCDTEAQQQGIKVDFVQSSVSWNAKQGTLRGLHYQTEPQETKLIRCTRGRIYDVLVDLRPDSTTYRRWLSIELAPETGQLLYVPPGIAHGFQTLAANTEVYYQISAFYNSQSAKGVRWNDPAFAVHWPYEPTVISPRDQNWSDYG